MTYSSKTILLILLFLNALSQPLSAQSDPSFVCTFGAYTQAQDSLCKVPDQLPLLLVKNTEPVANDESLTLLQRNQDVLLRFVYNNINYPVISRQHQVEGVVVMSMVITRDGNIDPQSIRCLRDIGDGWAAEGIRVVQLMHDLQMKWQPAMKDGEPVPYRYNFPIRVKLG